MNRIALQNRHLYQKVFSAGSTQIYLRFFNKKPVLFLQRPSSVAAFAFKSYDISRAFQLFIGKYWKQIEISAKLLLTASSAHKAYQIIKEFNDPIEYAAKQAQKEIVEVLVRSAKKNHRFKSRTGRLQGSIGYQQLSQEIIKLYVSAPYGEEVMYKTNDFFLDKAVEENKVIIDEILKRHMDKAIRYSENKVKGLIVESGKALITEGLTHILVGSAFKMQV